jgi:enterochelin esterase-like enzyme
MGVGTNLQIRSYQSIMKYALHLVLALAISAVAATGQQPCKPTVVGDLRIEHLQSKTYDTPVTLRVWLPPGYSNAPASHTKYPTLYMLDGQTAFDECTAFHGEHELQIDETVTKLISEHKIPPIIIVGIDSSTHRNYEYSPYRDSITDPHAPDPIGKQLPSFLAEEVLPFISSHYRVSDDPAHTGIGGTSLGASAALYVSLNRPDLFRLALIQSPNLMLGNGQLLRDTAFIVRAPDRIAIGIGATEVNFPRIEDYLAPLGLKERDTDLGAVKMAETLATNLKGAYFKRPDVMLVVQPGATHSSEFWAQRLPDAIQFLYRESKSGM